MRVSEVRCALSEVCEVSLRLRALRVWAWWGMRACVRRCALSEVLGGDAGAEECAAVPTSSLAVRLASFGPGG